MLERTGWNRKRAARRLGISYKTLLQKIRDCEVELRD
jgi:DNA-binding NtrC family response regulator